MGAKPLENDQMSNRIYVCENCIEDPALQAVVRDNLISEECDYCGRTAEIPIACEIDDVIERVRFAIYQEYAPPDEETTYDPEEGDYAGNVLEHTDVFDEIGFTLSNEDLWNDIVGTFWDERFCPIGMWPGSPSERQLDAWSGFKKIIKHRRRYTFWSIADDECDHGISEHPPARMMQSIVDAMSFFNLTKTLPPRCQFWRVRVHEQFKSLVVPNEIAAPTPEQAIYANRMSPAGVPMFYGADDFETAADETANPKCDVGKFVTGGAFQNLRAFNILDLCQLPVMESFFVDWNTRQREALAFLRAFQDDISMEVTKDGLHNIEFVPTQVFTEFVRFELTAPSGEPIDGIRYRSSKNNRGCYVLFVDQEDCLPNIEFRRRDQQLEFVPGSLTTMRVTWRLTLESISGGSP